MCATFPTGHVDHSAVAILHQVPRLTVNPAGCDAVAAEEVWIHRRGLAVTPGRRQVCQLRKMKVARAEPLRANCLLGVPSCAWSINAVIWPFCQHCDKCINLCWEKPMLIYVTLRQKRNSHFNQMADAPPESVVCAFLLHSHSSLPLSFHCGAHTLWVLYITS